MKHVTDPADVLEALDKKFKRGATKLARELRKSESIAKRTGAYAFAIEQRAQAEVWEHLAEHGITVVDD